MSVTVHHHPNTNTYTVTFNGGADHILATVTSSGADVSDWIDDMLRIHRFRLHRLAVGLDIEWRPSYSAFQNPVAVLQLCVGRQCLVFQIKHADYVPDELDDFLTDPRFTFFGVGIHGDVEKIEDHVEACSGLTVCNAVDLGDYAAERTSVRAMKRMGLKDLAWEIMSVDVEKPRWVTMSRWDDEELTLDQVGYAAMDAYLSFEIGRRLMDGEFEN